MYPRRLTPHPQVLAGAHYFPPAVVGLAAPAVVGLAARLRAPTPPAMLTLGRLALPKLGGAGGAPAIRRPGLRRSMEAGGTGSAGRADAVA